MEWDPVMTRNWGILGIALAIGTAAAWASSPAV